MLRAFLLSLLLTASLAVITIDLNQQNQYSSNTILDTTCNKDTQIDLFFNPNSKISCGGSTCTTTSLDSSTMKFMDINGNDLDLTLVGAQAVSNADVVVNNLGVAPDYYFAFRFDTTDSARKVYVLVPVMTTASTNTKVIDVTKIADGTFANFQSPSTTGSLPLTTFSYLNKADYSKFYHVTNLAKTETLLMSTTVLKLPSQSMTTTAISSTFTPDYAVSGNKLCYASNQSEGLFQTHLRQSWPLWTWVISIIIYWMYYLLADSDTHQCYDKKFQENRMTCWGFYSLHYLGHIQYFTRLSRLSLLYFVFSFQAMVLSAVYSTLGDNKDPYTNFEIIIWSAAIAFGASLPIPYILGGIFLRGIYRTTLQKFKVIKKSRGTMMNKAQQEQIYEHEVDRLEQKLYSYYYIFYVIIFIGMVCFWVPSIYMMMQIHRNWYYLQRIWLASLGIAFVLDNLIFDPILSRLLGHTTFYRMRGYFYEFVLSQEYKEIEQ